MKENPWLLPAGIDEVLPQEARQLESLRRKLLDLYDSWGYELVIPPMIEYLESLLTGTGSDLDLQTFKLVDQLNGRMMGVRADMTPQVARIDARRLATEAPTRLCYMGTVLHTRPDGFAGSRSPYQVGAELYGHAGPQSDAEILSLLLETLRATGINDIYLDLGHVGIFRGLSRQIGLSVEQETQLFDMLQRKALPEIDAYLRELDVKQGFKKMLSALASLNGDAGVLDAARKTLKPAGKTVLGLIDYLEEVASELERRAPGIPVHYDLAELRGYRYQTGIVFAAFVPGYGQEIARGGRYDDIGVVFGRARPATGFSTDLRSLIKLGAATVGRRPAVLAPADADESLVAAVRQLRAAGERVVHELTGQRGSAADLGCDRRLLRKNGQWVVVSITK
ncbi:MAG TPA: ATP phosphoribosyltransferase regulatory subunit [Gammaproteobacteria bacterium]|nr:ATP phosphoribosyltransferase regulatory subunit [Gammaproteobacteria bacterium]